jgi:hypothetical protein
MGIKTLILIAIFGFTISRGIKVYTKTYPFDLKQKIIEGCSDITNISQEKLEKYRQVVNEAPEIALKKQCTCYANAAEKMKLGLPATYVFGFLLFPQNLMSEITQSKSIMDECVNKLIQK